MTAKIRALSEQETAPRERDKRRKFVQLAEKRTANAMRAIRVIAKLGNKAHYEYDEKDVKKIAAVLSREVEALRTRMTSRGGQETIEFRL
jgi:DNA-binding MarR family transcriptional regulator